MSAQRILLVEDNPGDARLVSEWLRGGQGWEIEAVGSLANAMRETEKQVWDVILLDLSLPDSLGIAAIEKIRASAPASALVIFTGSEHLELAVTALKLGADDYLVKNQTKPELLDRTLRHALQKKRAETELERANRARAELQAEKELEARKSRAIFEGAYDGIVIVDDEQNFVDANAAACALFGLPRPELLKRKLHDFVTVNPTPDEFGTWNDVRKYSSRQGLYTLITASGEKRTLEYSATENLMPGHHLSILRDVTELREAKEERDRLFNVSLDLICVAGKDGKFVRMNPACMDILGYTPEEMCSKPIVDFIHPDDIENTHRQLSDCIGGSSVKSFENRYRMKSGGYRYLSWKSVTIGDYIYATARDNTERNRMQAQLLQSDRMAAVGTLAAGVAHEINNPLGYALTNLQLILEEIDSCSPGDPRVGLREKLQLVLDGTSRVREVVRGLKMFSRNDEDRIAPIQIRSALEAAARLAFHEIQPRARLVLNFGSTPNVRANEGRLSQVFLNLLINSAQAIPEGAPDKNEISMSCMTDAQGNCRVEVRDTGSGIPDAIRSQIFDPFFTTKPVGTGTGLGLSICDGIIRALNGKIEIESEVGKGTCIAVTLLADNAEIVPAREAPEPITVSNERLKIIIVDDEAYFLSTISDALKRFHDVSAFTDSNAALKEILVRPNFDVILSDIMMPGATGIDIYQALKADGRGLEKRMIIMTGGAFTPRAIEFMKSVDVARIEKPFNIGEIRARLANFKKFST